MEFGVGSIVEGKVTGITKFGAFVSLPGGKSGLVHISEIAYSYVSEVAEFLKEGQEVKVIGIDESNRINLSIKKATEPPPKPAGAGVGGGRAPRPYNNNAGAPRGGSFASRPAASKEPMDFEDRLKQFMQSSDSKLSELRYMEKKGSSRRGGGRR